MLIQTQTLSWSTHESITSITANSVRCQRTADLLVYEPQLCHWTANTVSWGRYAQCVNEAMHDMHGIV